MRVLHVINTLGPGGAERSLRELLPGFAAAGLHSEVVVFSRVEVGVEADIVATGVPVHVLPPGGRAAQLVSLRRLIRTRRPDLVHTTIYEADVLGRLAAVGTGIPVVTSLVNTSYSMARLSDPSVSSWKLSLARRVDAVTARRLGAGFHAITRAVATDSVAQLGLDPTRITVIPRGRDRARLGEPSPARRRAARERLDVGDDEFLVLNVGRREFQKGQTTLVEAAAVLRDAGRPATVVVAGREGGESGRLNRRISELGLGGQVRFLGDVDDVPDLLCAADVLAFPSRFEGLGGAVIEALALGTPVVATDIPALAEVLDGGRCGLLVPVDDPAALAGALQQVHSDPDGARARADAGRDRFETEYTLSGVTERMVEWLCSFVARPAASADVS